MEFSSRDVLQNDTKKKKVLILYHTGSGSTQVICELLKENLCSQFNVMLESIYNFDNKLLDVFDFIIFGTPCYHCEPSESMQDFIKKLPVIKHGKNAFVFATCGLHSGNTVRMMVKDLLKKNIYTVDSTVIRGPASDGALMLPSWISFMFNFEKTVLEKIKHMKAAIDKYIEIPACEENTKVPSFKWYSPFIYINHFGKKSYSKYIKNISVDIDRCTGCLICVNACERGCWTQNKIDEKSRTTSKVNFNYERCEFCLKCIHHCPSNAICFNNKMKDMPRLNNLFYNELKKRLLT